MMASISFICFLIHSSIDPIFSKFSIRCSVMLRPGSDTKLLRTRVCDRVTGLARGKAARSNSLSLPMMNGVK
jgi:hypothetical protein